MTWRQPFQYSSSLRSELSNGIEQSFTVHVEASEGDDAEVTMMSIRNERHICFHIATTTCTNRDIENAKAVCACLAAMPFVMKWLRRTLICLHLLEASQE